MSLRPASRQRHGAGPDRRSPRSASRRTFQMKTGNRPELRGKDLDEAAVLAKTSELARHRVVESCVRLVYLIANRYVRFYSADCYVKDLRGDMVSEGVIGIYDAIRAYDPHRGSFLGCAWNWIRSRIGRFVAGEYDTRLTLLSESDEQRDSNGDEFKNRLEHSSKRRSELPSPEESAERSEIHRIFGEELAKVKAKTPRNHRGVLVMRIEALHKATLQEAGDVCGFSREMARRVENKAVKRLEKRLRIRLRA